MLGTSWRRIRRKLGTPVADESGGMLSWRRSISGPLLAPGCPYHPTRRRSRRAWTGGAGAGRVGERRHFWRVPGPVSGLVRRRGKTVIPRLNPVHVPADLRKLIPLAERYGIIDDLEREEFVLRASPEEVAELKAAVAQHDAEMDRWLAGPEADHPPFSDEYLAFSAMRMAADYA